MLRCDDFVFFCEDHRKFYSSPHIDPTNNFKSCCSEFFDPKPFFTNEGTCFTTKKDVVETYPSPTSSLKIWLMQNEDEAPGECEASI
jgi:hypothetical protein